MTAQVPYEVPQIVMSLRERFSKKVRSCNPVVYWQKSGDKVNLWVVISLPEDSAITLLEEAEKVVAAVLDTQETTGQTGELRIAERSHFASEELHSGLTTRGYTHG